MILSPRLSIKNNLLLLSTHRRAIIINEVSTHIIKAVSEGVHNKLDSMTYKLYVR